MNPSIQPAIFVSCVSPEFRSTRQRIANILTRLGYTPVFQEIFGSESGDLREALRRKIDGCEGLIQIVGRAYGAEPTEPDAEFGRVSYTQYEFLYARKRGKKTWLIFAGDGCSTDTPIDKLDLPQGPATAEPAASQAEKRALQEKYVEARKADGHLYHPVQSNEGLELAIERLEDNFAELRKKFLNWQFRFVAAFVSAVTVLSILAAALWWSQHRQENAIQTLSTGVSQITAESRKVTKGKIREQLTSAAEQTYQAELAEADKPRSWQERQRLRDAAKKEQVIRLSRIDDLATSFAELEGTAGASKVLNEMTRILAEEGVDQAINYVGTQRGSILDTVKARAAAAHEKNRADLGPLLKSAQLNASRGRYDQAAELFKDILAIEPDWTAALRADCQLLIDWGDRAVQYETSDAAMLRFDQARRVTDHLIELEPGNSDWQLNLSVCLDRIGDVKKAQGDLSGELSAYQRSLDITTKLAAADPTNARVQLDLGVSLDGVGDVKRAQGDLAGALAAYQRFMDISTKLVAADPANAQWQRDLSVSLSKIGNVKTEQGDLAGALAAYQRFMDISTKLAAADPANAQLQRDLSISLNKIGDVKKTQGDLVGALAAYQQDLEIATKLATADPINAQGQRDLSVSLNKIGDVKKAQGDLAGALAAYQQDLEIATKLAAADPDNAQRQRDLAISLQRIFNVKKAQGDLAGVLSTYQQSMAIAIKLVLRRSDQRTGTTQPVGQLGQHR